jgi:hypothetical protein
VWSAEERAEGLEYMHPKPSSHSGRIVGKPEVIRQLPSCPPFASNSLQTRIDSGTLGPIRNAKFLYRRAQSDGRTSPHKKEQGGVR